MNITAADRPHAEPRLARLVPEPARTRPARRPGYPLAARQISTNPRPRPRRTSGGSLAGRRAPGARRRRRDQRHRPRGRGSSGGERQRQAAPRGAPASRGALHPLLDGGAGRTARSRPARNGVTGDPEHQLPARDTPNQSGLPGRWAIRQKTSDTLAQQRRLDVIVRADRNAAGRDQHIGLGQRLLHRAPGRLRVLALGTSSLSTTSLGAQRKGSDGGPGWTRRSFPAPEAARAGSARHSVPGQHRDPGAAATRTRAPPAARRWLPAGQVLSLSPLRQRSRRLRHHHTR